MLLSKLGTRLMQVHSNPKLTTRSPTTAVGITPTALTISGSGFLPGGNVSLVSRTNNSQVLCTAYVRVSPTSITCTTPNLGQSAGAYSLTVRNPDGEAASILFNIT